MLALADVTGLRLAGKPGEVAKILDDAGNAYWLLAHAPGQRWRKTTAAAPPTTVARWARKIACDSRALARELGGRPDDEAFEGASAGAMRILASPTDIAPEALERKFLLPPGWGADLPNRAVEVLRALAELAAAVEAGARAKVRSDSHNRHEASAIEDRLVADIGRAYALAFGRAPPHRPGPKGPFARFGLAALRTMGITHITDQALVQRFARSSQTTTDRS